MRAEMHTVAISGIIPLFMVISMVLIGIAGPWSNFGGPTMSVTWFPVSERITAQAIASVSTFLGGVAAFVRVQQ